MRIKSLMTAILAVASVTFASAKSSMTAQACADKTKVAIVLNNENHMTGFQFDAVYPEDWTVKVVKGQNLKKTDEDGENLFSLKWKYNTCLVYSDCAAEIENGEVVIIQVTAPTNGTLKLTNIKGVGSGVYAVTTAMDDVEINFKNGEYTTETSTDPVTPPTINNNYLTMETVQCIKGNMVEMPVSLTNTSNITDIGFVVELPNGITLDKTSKGKYYINFTERADGHIMTANEIDGGVKMAITNMDGLPFEGNEGVIFTLPLNVSSTLANGNYTIRLKEVQLSDGNLYETADVQGTVTVVNYTKGDVNNDGRIAVNDISLTIQAYLGNVSSNFIMYAGDMNDNGKIDVADISKVINAYLGKSANAPAKAAARAEAEDNLTLENVTTEAGGTFDLVIGLNNTKPYTEIGGYIALPEGMTFATNNKGKHLIALDEDRLPGHTVSANLQENGELKFAIVNMEGEPVEGNSGTIMKVTVNVAEDMADGDYEVIMRELQLSDGDLYEIADVKATVTVGQSNPGTPDVEEPTTDDNLTLDNVTTEVGGTFDLVIGLNNTKPYTEIGGYIALPEGMTFATNNKGKHLITLDEDRLPGHTVSANIQENGELKFVIVNMDGEPVEGNSGTIMKVTVNVAEDMAVGDYEVIMHELQLSDGDLYEIADVKATVTVTEAIPDAINSMSNDARMGDRIYRIDGTAVKKIGHGLYIVNGKKVVK